MSDRSVPERCNLRSPVGFAATLDRLTVAIERSGSTIFARIDHAAGARQAGLEMPPTVVLIYGNPKGGTPIMIAGPDAALDLPLRVLIRERTDGSVVVIYYPIAATLIAAGVPAELAARLEPAQTLIATALGA